MAVTHHGFPSTFSLSLFLPSLSFSLSPSPVPPPPAPIPSLPSPIPSFPIAPRPVSPSIVLHDAFYVGHTHWLPLPTPCRARTDRHEIAPWWSTQKADQKQEKQIRQSGRDEPVRQTAR
ncbi:hypothetical protein ASPZODRAFT_126372 [Penicilliopsis zonata CBS 506.65]|uniref:Uncharacterized protein n=1 Tax=Penicilliopsis zonata CBS 506.65 TaxID=1073090 RepID=A0A1L9STS3_9EURO|nr:hypothetical protein ASPZODRAFT_126372 [Penicilliopsis zonata CBS 506.65]OJJ50487.1 hypothetical protein ASPZODRAFT_126372 [Penicilliopsis zonata CBS 506.65]